MSAYSGSKTKVYVVYYSMYGHIAQLAQEVAKGAEEAGADVKVWRIAETLPQEILDKMHAPPANKDIPVITPDDLKSADAIIFGVPTRYGQGASQTKAFWDATGQLWQTGALVGKVAGVFFSSATQGGGQETTALTQLTHFVHHGMVYVPIGYSNANLFNMDEIHGGSPYGAGTFAGPTGARQPTKLEKEVAHHQGKHTATIAIALKVGREAVAK